MKKRELENYELIRKTLGAEKKYFGCQKAKTIEKFLSVLNKITFFGRKVDDCVKPRTKIYYIIFILA